MKLKTFIQKSDFTVIHEGTCGDTELTKPFCCDLLSLAMGRGSKGCVWITVMGNINTLAVASLNETGCIILAEGSSLDEAAAARAVQEDITVLSSGLPVFETALAAYKILQS